jgi:hypothetical protein
MSNRATHVMARQHLGLYETLRNYVLSVFKSSRFMLYSHYICILHIEPLDMFMKQMTLTKHRTFIACGPYSCAGPWDMRWMSQGEGAQLIIRQYMCSRTHLRLSLRVAVLTAFSAARCAARSSLAVTACVRFSTLAMFFCASLASLAAHCASRSASCGTVTDASLHFFLPGAPQGPCAKCVRITADSSVGLWHKCENKSDTSS